MATTIYCGKYVLLIQDYPPSQTAPSSSYQLCLLIARLVDLYKRSARNGHGTLTQESGHSSPPVVHNSPVTVQGLREVLNYIGEGLKEENTTTQPWKSHHVHRM